MRWMGGSVGKMKGGKRGVERTERLLFIEIISIPTFFRMCYVYFIMSYKNER
jgi:hypothetical protein